MGTLLWPYRKQLFVNKLDNLFENDTFLERHKLLKLIQQGIENVNRPITGKDTE